MNPRSGSDSSSCPVEPEALVMKGQGSALLSRFPLRECVRMAAPQERTQEPLMAVSSSGPLFGLQAGVNGLRGQRGFRFTAAGRLLAVVPFVSKKHERYPVLALLALFIRAGISFCSFRHAKNMTGRACRCDCCDCCDSTSCGVLVAFCPSQAA